MELFQRGPCITNYAAGLSDKPLTHQEVVAVAIDQIAITYEFKNGKPGSADAFDASFLPSTAERKAN